MSSDTPGQEPGQPPPHRPSAARTVFRALGPLVVLVAIALTVAAFADLVQADLDREPTKLWMFFVGIPLLGVGGFLANLGYGGAHARYLAREYSPALRTVSHDLGLRDGRGQAGSGPYCRSCGTRNDADARFCDSCGTSMVA